MRELAERMASEGIDDTIFIDMRKLVGYTDYLVVATSPKMEQTRSLVHNLADFAKERKLPARIDNDKSGAWSVIDMGEFVIHLFSPLARDFYQLEKLWGMAPQERVQSLRHAV
jgi:ribosome-associated protein